MFRVFLLVAAVGSMLVCSGLVAVIGMKGRSAAQSVPEASVAAPVAPVIRAEPKLSEAEQREVKAMIVEYQKAGICKSIRGQNVIVDSGIWRTTDYKEKVAFAIVVYKFLNDTELPEMKDVLSHIIFTDPITNKTLATFGKFGLKED